MSPDLIGFIGYAADAAAMTVLALLLATSWRGRLQGGLLLLAVAISVLWAGLLAIQAQWHMAPVQMIWAAEAARMVAWCLFLLRVLDQLRQGLADRLRLLRWGVLVGGLLLLLPFEDWLPALVPAGGGWLAKVRLIGQLLLTVSGLFLVEQVYRNTPWQHRWGIKFLCFGLGAVFVYDFYFFADALLFGRLDTGVWLARGGVNAVVTPLLAVSVARNPQWSFDLAVSRSVVVHSTALMAAGVYLLFMALAGYYIRAYGGEWSAVFQPLFFFGAAVVLIVLLFSGQLRSRLKHFISKHFYSYRYDYREEWLRLISVLSGKELQATLPERIILALAELVDSPGGAVWVRDPDGNCVFRRCWNLPLAELDVRWEGSDVCAALQPGGEVIELAEPAPAASLSGTLPGWLLANENLWLLVPLMHETSALGFVVLARPRAPQQLGWENIQLLQTAARQAASYLALEEAAAALAEARQFEGFNRLSAFVVHDLKNLVAQLSLVSRNAERYRDNPAFVDDALQTVRDSVDRMNRLLLQMRAATPTGKQGRVALLPLLDRAVSERAVQSPVPSLRVADGVAPEVCVDAERLQAVLRNVIQNAQDATDKQGRVTVTLREDGDMAVVEIEDDGCGMDEEFIRERLFRPFDSTKGLAGMGIGAYECKALVALAGGCVDVDSEPGAGTRFSIRLPQSAAPVEQPLAAVI
ncbi:XrtA/PEP-CTERM system histidine kinase PrsK [Thiohalocapsa sp.]|uniref:XrtA/PEP-CTERM system histidine kinase PrsK n=1 Tax=Thiohalocapsa sp. TaxID=2497641 RepID=UPI0026013E36|nr:XrtA/PEP-CTERM system histidine kinase PrsK [Thiohalocapsa sp.]